MSNREITPELLLNAYASGIFPMADRRDDPELFWVDPLQRGILPLDGFHLSRSLKKAVRKTDFSIRVNTAFKQVVNACAAPAIGRDGTWISTRIEELYTDLHQRGFAHSVECWHHEQLVGGLYGVCINGAFFGESMFHTASNASKIALVHLVARLNAGGFNLLDTQFGTDHLAQFGVIEIPREDYQERLGVALQNGEADFYRMPAATSPDAVIQFSTHTS